MYVVQVSVDTNVYICEHTLAWWRLDGWGAGRPRPGRKEGKWDEGPSLAITAMFCLEFAYVFWLSGIH